MIFFFNLNNSKGVFGLDIVCSNHQTYSYLETSLLYCKFSTSVCILIDLKVCILFKKPVSQLYTTDYSGKERARM